VRVTGFVRYALGEGIERSKADFAAEVAAQLGG
jgi:elongation factor Ts